MRALIAITMLAVAGCTTVQYRPVQLPLPARPVLTPIRGGSLQCLSNDTYVAIVNRERGYKRAYLELRAIIEANNAQAK